MPTIRLLLTFAAAKKLKVSGFDVKTAFLYGYLEEKIYMQQPIGHEKEENKVFMRNK